MIILDGAMGTTLWDIAQRNGAEKVPVWRYNIEHPEFVAEITRRYIDAGADFVQANTFGANRPAVKKSSKYDVKDVVAAGMRIARETAAGKDVKIFLSSGPLMEMLEPYGDLEEDECREIYGEIFDAAMPYKPDAILLETFLDLGMMRVAAERAMETDIPVFCSMSFEKSGRTMFGNSVEDVVGTLEPLGITAVGLNCSLGPDSAVPIIKDFSGKTSLPLIFKPNAGLPVTTEGAKTTSAVGPKEFAEAVSAAFPYVTYVGGCCGSDWRYVEAIKEKLLEKGSLYL